MQELQGGYPLQIGPYRLKGRLGAGGMGKVFLGRSPGGRLVAVKVIREELAGDAEFRARFRREVARARMVSGLFTAPVVDADLDGPVPWLATAYVPGPSLTAAVAGHGQLPAESVLALAAALAEGLAAIHAAGVVHRDLKPSNVLLAADGPRIIDFGIARATEETALTQTGLVMGSPGFMSPEQAQGRDVGPASDVFSLGAVLTFSATGGGPFGKGAADALIYRVVHGAPDLERVPGQLRAVVGRCLAKEPGRRPTPAQLLAELGGADLTADWLPAPIARTLPPTLAETPNDAATITSSRLDQHPQTALPTPADEAAPAGRPPRARPEPAGSVLARLEHETRVTDLVFSPDGAKMATVSGETVRLWETIPRELGRLRHPHYVRGVAFSPDGALVVTRTSGPAFGWHAVTLWDAAAGTERAQLRHRHLVSAATFSPDGTRIATVIGGDKAARLWDPAGGQEIAQLRHGSTVSQLLFSPDGTRVVMLGPSAKGASLWDTVTGREVTRIRHARPVKAVKFSPDSTRLVTFSEEGVTRLWDTATGREQPWRTRTLLWDAATGREQPWAERMTHWTAAFNAHSTRVATAGTDRMIRLWDPATGQEIARMPHDGTITIMCFSPDGTRLATAGSDKLVRLWDPANGREHIRLPHDNKVTMVGFKPDGTRLITASADETAQLWDPVNGQEISRMPHGGMRVFSPDATRLATAREAFTVQLLDTETGTELARMRHHDPVQEIIFSPDGSQLATRGGNTANLWAT